MSEQPIHLWCRAEIKPHEHRTALTPQACETLLQNGFQITVERSGDEDTRRCYSDEDYEKVGCRIAEHGSWVHAPKDAYIVGVKELPEDGSALIHRHIFFAHCYKHQGGWKEMLGRFVKGNGELLDLEFLNDDQGRRVAAFGYMAGFAGGFVGVEAWCQQILADGAPLGEIKPYPNDEELLGHIRARLAAAAARSGRAPRVLVMGALGRCGNGAVDFCTRAGIADITKWDMAETKDGGPFPAILEHDIFINCIYLSKKIPPFVTTQMLESDKRLLTVVTDVSCDTSNPDNPLPFANKNTTFVEPTFRIQPSQGPAVDIVTIDHLPTLLPKESSDRFAHDLLPTMLALKEFNTNSVWQRALKLFRDKVAESQQAN